MQTKEDIVKRNLKNRLNNPAAKNGGLSRDPSKSNFGDERPCTYKQITETNVDLNHISQVHFTDSDKRLVLNKFLANKEILFLIYGLMFPYRTLMAAK